MNVKTYFTKEIENLIKKGELYESSILESLLKFSLNDWGKLCEEDSLLQNELLKMKDSKKNERFMGVYKFLDIKFWIISNYDYTIDTLIITVLLPEEY